MIHKGVRLIAQPLSSKVLGVIGEVEAKSLPDRPLHYPPFFVVGPPRSGSTHLGQVISYALDVSYIPNLTTNLLVYKKRPPVVCLTRLAKTFGLIRKQGVFESYYGSAKNFGEAADSDPIIWRYVFPEGYLDEDSLSEELGRTIYKTIAGIERIFNRPFVDKSVGHSIRIRALVKMFPDALFVRSRRDPLAVAQSVYIGRDRNEATRRSWPTPKARGYLELSQKSLVEQACGQQYIFERDIDEGLAAVPRERQLDVNYADLCANPQGEVEKIAAFMNLNGAETRPINRVPDSFRLSNSRRVDVETYRNLVEHVERIYGPDFERLEEPRKPGETDGE